MITAPVSIAIAAAVALTVPVPAPAPAPQGMEATSTSDPGRQTLAPRDGWASFDGGTTGGANAAPDDVHEVSTRDELAAAVAGNKPKIVYVKAGRYHLFLMSDIDAFIASRRVPAVHGDSLDLDDF